MTRGPIVAVYTRPVMEPPVAGDTELAAMARAIAAARSRLSDHFDPALFSNPGLEIMTFLFAEGLHGQTVTTNACCQAARVPRTTALRWIKLLQDRGLIDGSADVSDRRVTMLGLSDTGRAKMRAWLADIGTRTFHFPDPPSP